MPLDLTKIQCPKCHAVSGDDWKQCGGSCPMVQSPHYDPKAMKRAPASFGVFQLAMLDGLAYMADYPGCTPNGALPFLSGYLRAAGYEIIADAMMQSQRRMIDAQQKTR